MTDPDEKKAVVQRLSEERGLDPTGRIEELISQNKVMLFIKGTKAFPQCGFSNTVVRLIEDCTDDFETFDVLSDENTSNVKLRLLQSSTRYLPRQLTRSSI